MHHLLTLITTGQMRDKSPSRGTNHFVDVERSRHQTGAHSGERSCPVLKRTRGVEGEDILSRELTCKIFCANGDPGSI